MLGAEIMDSTIYSESVLAGLITQEPLFSDMTLIIRICIILYKLAEAEDREHFMGTCKSFLYILPYLSKLSL